MGAHWRGQVPVPRTPGVLLLLLLFLLLLQLLLLILLLLLLRRVLLLLQLESAFIRLAAATEVGFPRLLNVIISSGRACLKLCPCCIWVAYIKDVKFHFDPVKEYNTSCTVTGSDDVDRQLSIKYPLPL